MLHNIRLGTELAAPPADIYAMYLDPIAHSAITDSSVSIAAHAGAKFTAFRGTIGGTILHLVPGRVIVQTWRSNVFKRSDPDSILILTLSRRGPRSTVVDLQQINVPEQDFAGISHGWELYYFAPWREYLRKRKAEARAARRAAESVRPAASA